MMKTAKNYIKSARVLKGMTQEQVAKRLGIKQSTLSQWEKDIDHVSFGDVRRLCKVLEISIGEVEA